MHVGLIDAQFVVSWECGDDDDEFMIMLFVGFVERVCEKLDLSTKKRRKRKKKHIKTVLRLKGY